jgi:hypothetical protein
MKVEVQERIVEGLAALLGWHAAHQGYLSPGKEAFVPSRGPLQPADSPGQGSPGGPLLENRGAGGKPPRPAVNDREQFSCHTPPLGGEQ